MAVASLKILKYQLMKYLTILKQCSLPHLRGQLLVALACLWSSIAMAIPSVPYMPTWQARHHLERLVDEADLAITTTHWPLPLAAVQQAIDDLPKELPANLAQSRDFIIAELRKVRWQGQLDLQYRNRAEAPVGFGENYTPGSSVKITTPATEFGSDALTVAAKVGIKLEQNSNSAQTSFSGFGKEGHTTTRLDDTSLVLEGLGINWQLFSHQNWWGPGWQSSLINSNNAPPWMGVGFQRSEVKPSESKWLNWMGPWNFEFFVAKAQDPVLVQDQPAGYIFSGMRLTFRPTSWVEVGLTRDIQTGGSGRPLNLTNAVFGWSTHTSGADINNSYLQQDQSNGVAGYDLKLSCPKTWGCAAYLQWMGEDAAGQSHMPNQFMTLSGVEYWTPNGQHRFFGEFIQTYTDTLPWDTTHIVGSGMRNWAYPQGETNGGRWFGSSFGGDARVFTLGWLDAGANRMIKIYTGESSTALGSYNPNTNATGNLIGPHGQLHGASVQQSIKWRQYTFTPEFSYTHFAQGQSVGDNRKTDLRGGLTFSMPLGK